jgi:hypothetical protein
MLFDEPVLEPPGGLPDAWLALAVIAEAFKNRRSLRKPARVVYTNLKNRRRPAGVYCRDPLSFLPAEFLQRAGLAAPEPQPEPDLENAMDTPGEDESTPEPPADPSLDLPAGRPDKTAAQAWQEALGELRLQMPDSLFRRWVSQSELVRFDPEECAFTAAVDDDKTCLWLEDRLTRLLERLLVGICNRPARVRFVLWEEEPSPAPETTPEPVDSGYNDA